MMDLDTSELLRSEEVEKLNEKSKEQFVLLPEHLEGAAEDILAWRDKQRKALSRKRRKIAKESRRRNRR